MKGLSVKRTFFALQFLIVLSFTPFVAPELLGLIALSVFLGLTGWLNGRLAKIASAVIFVSGLVLIRLRFEHLAGVDVSVAFLLLCLGVKLMEVRERRDYYVVFCVDLFVIGGLFLLSQSLVTTVWVFALIVLILGLMVRINLDYPKDSRLVVEPSPDQPTSSGLRSLGLLIGFATPLLIGLFLFFPRLPPLWSVPVAGSSAQTGLSDTVSPGDIADLSQSAKLSFRVTFAEGRVPPRSELYFRALVMSQFDGAAWTQSEFERSDRGFGVSDFNQGRKPAWLDTQWSQEASESWLPYEVSIEPNQRDYVFALDAPLPRQSAVRLTQQRTLRSDRPIATRTRFALYQVPYEFSAQLSAESQQFYTYLPAASNPLTRALAQQLYRQSGSDPAQYVSAVLRHFNQEPFRYTLKPERLRGERVDEFMFQTQGGFCGHYASAFAFMMRAVGIPARLVAGYQGGEPSSVDGSWTVREMDAHAWTEVWVSDQWRRVDPTAAVAPERVEQGMEGFLDTSGSQSFGEGAFAGAAYQQYRWLSDMRRYADELSYRFERDVVGYDADDQKNGLFKALGIKSLAQQVAAIIGVFVVVVALFYGWMWIKNRPKKREPMDELVEKLSLKLAPYQAQRNQSEGVISWLERLAANYKAPAALSLAKRYRIVRYGKTSVQLQPGLDQRLKREIIKQVKSEVKAQQKSLP